MRVLQRVGSETSRIESTHEHNEMILPQPCSRPMTVVFPPLALQLPSLGRLFASPTLLTLNRLRSRPSDGTEPLSSYTSMSTGLGGQAALLMCLIGADLGRALP
jgi:hypothetical protein